MMALLDGALAMACAVAGLFFLRFWRTIGDRLFVFFSLAFWVLGVEWAVLGSLTEAAAETRPIVYLPRLLAFILIVVGIWDKNRGRGRRPQENLLRKSAV
jgi:hypothetical protein